jgi:hypothetical protein
MAMRVFVPRCWHHLFTSGILVVGWYSARLCSGMDTPLWLDETFTRAMLFSRLPGLIRRLLGGCARPDLLFLMWVWEKLFGRATCRSDAYSSVQHRGADPHLSKGTRTIYTRLLGQAWSPCGSPDLLTRLRLVPIRCYSAWDYPGGSLHGPPVPAYRRNAILCVCILFLLS